jgi:hypothetical protein
VVAPPTVAERRPRAVAADSTRVRRHSIATKRVACALRDGYKDFDQGAAKKYVFNPNGLIKA